MYNLTTYFLIRKTLLVLLLTFLTTQFAFSQEWLVTNESSNQIRKVNVSNGTSTLWSSAVSKPVGIAKDNSNHYWVTSYQSNSNSALSVYRLNSAGTLVNTIVVNSNTGLGNNGWQISMGADGLLYMSGSNSGMYTINPTTFVVSQITSSFTAGVDMGTSSAYLRSNTNNVYRGNTLLISNASSGAPYPLGGVRGVMESDGYIYVADGQANVIKRYNSSGGGQITFTTFPEYCGPTGIEKGIDGNIYSVCYTSNKIFKTNSSGITSLVSTSSSGLSGPKFMVEYNSTPITCNSTPLNLCAPNILKAYNMTEIGVTCENPQRNLPLVLWVGNINYQVKPGTAARMIEYTDGTVKAVLEVVKNNGTIGNVDLTQGFNIELTGSQKTTGTPASPWTPAVGCAPNANNWTFYNTFELKMCGTGTNAGTNYTVTNPAQAMNHPLQIGTGANALNGSLGGGIWFGNFTGDFNFNLSPITLTPLTVNAGADKTICYNQSTTLTAIASGGTSPYTYTWSDGKANGAIRGPLTNPTNNYTVTVTDANNCTASDQVTVTVNPQLNFSPASDEVCAGGNYTKIVNATGGTPPYTSYNWCCGLGTGNQKSLPATNATYTITVTDSKGCTAVGSFAVTAGSFSATASNDGPLTCLKTTVTMTANPSGMTYSWSGGGTARTKNVTTPGTYTVTVTDTNGCTALATTTVAQNITVPTPTANNDGPLTCTKTSVTLTATGGGTYCVERWRYSISYQDSNNSRHLYSNSNQYNKWMYSGSNDNSSAKHHSTYTNSQ